LNRIHATEELLTTDGHGWTRITPTRSVTVIRRGMRVLTFILSTRLTKEEKDIVKAAAK
jgi:hypothetical protein